MVILTGLTDSMPSLVQSCLMFFGEGDWDREAGDIQRRSHILLSEKFLSWRESMQLNLSNIGLCYYHICKACLARCTEYLHIFQNSPERLSMSQAHVWMSLSPGRYLESDFENDGKEKSCPLGFQRGRAAEKTNGVSGLVMKKKKELRSRTRREHMNKNTQGGRDEHQRANREAFCYMMHAAP